MPENTTNTDGAQDAPQSTDTPDAQDAGGTGEQDRSIDVLPEWAQEEIRSLRNESAGRRKKLREMEEAQRAAEQKRLAEQGQYKSLAEQRAAEVESLKPYQERAEQLETMIRTANERRVEQVRSDLKGMIPTDYPPEKLSAWLDANWSMLTRPAAGDIDAGAGSGGGSAKPNLTANEKAAGDLFGVDADKIEAQKQKRRLRRGDQ